MYKKILKQMAQKYCIQFIQDNFHPEWVGPGRSARLTIKQSPNGIVVFTAEVITDEGSAFYVDDKEVKMYEHYLLQGILHDSGNISITCIKKEDKEIGRYNLDTNKLEIFK